MTQIRAICNVRDRPAALIFEKMDWLGLRHPTFFIPTDQIPDHVRQAAGRYESVICQLMNRALFAECPDWRDVLEGQTARTIKELAALGVHHITWAIEHNLNGLAYHPATKDLVAGAALVERFECFYEVAKRADPQAVVMSGPYPHRFLNLTTGPQGWKSWVRRWGRRLRIDQVALDVHVGTWIIAPSRGLIAARLRDAVAFARDELGEVHFVEVGYPTTGSKPPIGLYGWGRERDQLSNFEICYETLSDLGVAYMQIYELIDPLAQMYEDCHTHGIAASGQKRFGDREPTFLGLKMREESHFGLFKKDGQPKRAAQWVRQVCGGA